MKLIILHKNIEFKSFKLFIRVPQILIYGCLKFKEKDKII